MTTIKNLLSGEEQKKNYYDENILDNPALNIEYIEKNIWLRYKKTPTRLELIQRADSLENAQLIIIESSDIQSQPKGDSYKGNVIVKLIESSNFTIEVKLNGRLIIIRKD